MGELQVDAAIPFLCDPPHLCSHWDLPWGCITLQWKLQHKMMRGQPWDAPLLEQGPWGSKCVYARVFVPEASSGDKNDQCRRLGGGGGGEIPASSYPVASK